jgi:hypothetical protein
MKGTNIRLAGDMWTIVDVAPAGPLAEMVAALLEEEGFVAQTRGLEALADALTHLGTHSAGATVVLVPERDAEAALALIEETVTDYEGEELDAVLARLAEDPDFLGHGEDDEDEDAALDRMDDEHDDIDELERLDGAGGPERT